MSGSPCIRIQLLDDTSVTQKVLLWGILSRLDLPTAAEALRGAHLELKDPHGALCQKIRGNGGYPRTSSRERQKDDAHGRWPSPRPRFRRRGAVRRLVERACRGGRRRTRGLDGRAIGSGSRGLGDAVFAAVIGSDEGDEHRGEGDPAARGGRARVEVHRARWVAAGVSSTRPQLTAA